MIDDDATSKIYEGGLFYYLWIYRKLWMVECLILLMFIIFLWVVVAEIDLLWRVSDCSWMEAQLGQSLKFQFVVCVCFFSYVVLNWSLLFLQNGSTTLHSNVGFNEPSYNYRVRCYYGQRLLYASQCPIEKVDIWCI